MSKRLFRLFPYVFPMLYIILASIKLMYPGINYDEIFWGNAALGGLDDTFIKRLFGIPLFIHDYIGALKPWFFMPIFKIFGVSVITIRVPMILVTAVSLILLYKATCTALGRNTGLVALVLSSVDASLIAHTRVDYGPVAFSFLFRVLTLLFVFKYLRTRKMRHLFVLGVVCILGFFNKFDFIWFINGVLVSLFIFFRKETFGKGWGILSRKLRVYIIAIVTLSSIGGIYLLTRLGFFRYIDFFYYSHLISILNGTFHLLNGQSFYNYMIGNMYTNLGCIYSVITLMIIGYVLLRRLTSGKQEDRMFLFLLLILLITFFQIIITNRSGASWHLIYVYPIFHILLASSIVYLSNNNKSLYVSAVIILASYQLFAYGKYVSAYDSVMKNPQWSKAIYKLIEYSKRTDDKFVSVDWGTHNQLLVFNGVKGKSFDEWVWFIKDPIPQPELIRLMNSYYGKDDVIFVTYAGAKSNFSRTRDMFFRICKEHGFIPHLAGTIDDEGDTVFELYKTTKLTR